jgi:hypothetical protein
MAIVDGCNGTGIDGKDYCYKPPTGTLVLMGDDMAPIRNFPLGVCEGGMCCSVARFFCEISKAVWHEPNMPQLAISRFRLRRR